VLALLAVVLGMLVWQAGEETHQPPPNRSNAPPSESSVDGLEQEEAEEPIASEPESIQPSSTVAEPDPEPDPEAASTPPRAERTPLPAPVAEELPPQTAPEPPPLIPEAPEETEQPEPRIHMIE